MRLALGPALVALLAGCGGGGGEARERFIARADAICARLATESRQLAETSFEGLTAAPAPDQIRAFERDLQRLQRSRLAELRALEPPPGDEAQVTEVILALQAAVEDPRSVPAGERAERLARDYGLDGCAGAPAAAQPKARTPE